MKKAKAKKKLKKINPHSRSKVKALEKAGAKVITLNKVEDLASIDKAPAAVEDVRAQVIADVAPAEVIPKGLVEITIDGTSLKLLGMKNQAAMPTLEQRVAIARRLNRVGPSLPRYVMKIIHEAKPLPAAPVPAPTTSIGDDKMGLDKHGHPDVETVGIACPLHSSCNCTKEERIAHGKKKVKQAEARKKMDVTPKHDLKKAAEPAAPAKGKGKNNKPAKDSDPKAAVKGVSAPPAKPKAGMNPGPVPKGGFTKDNKPVTSGELIRARIGEHKMTDDQIAAEVRKLWPGRTTAVSDVRWNRSQMQKAGVKNVPEPVEGSTVPGKKK